VKNIEEQSLSPGNLLAFRKEKFGDYEPYSSAGPILLVDLTKSGQFVLLLAEGKIVHWPQGFVSRFYKMIS